MKILFVCLGNVARSQMAEAFYNDFTKSKDAISAGTIPEDEQRYKVPLSEVIEVMQEEDIDVSDKKSKTVTKETVKKSDKIYVMCRKSECPEFLLKSKKVIFWKVKDPYQADLNIFRQIRDLIKEKVKSII